VKCRFPRLEDLLQERFFFTAMIFISRKISFSKVKTRSREELNINIFDFNETAGSMEKSVRLDMQLERERSYFVEAYSNIG
jgi:hypothetical protein